MKKPIVQTILIVVLLLHMIPLATIFLNSMRSNSSIVKQIFAFPSRLDLTNYVTAWNQGNYFVSFLNTFVIAFGVVFIVLFVELLAAYGLTKLPVYGRQGFIAYFVIGISLPHFAILVPLYFAFNALGLTNSKLGMILIYSAIFMPFTLLFMRSFFVGIPRELEEAALIDGCSELGALRRITLPLAVPIITTVALIVFVESYNEFLFSNIFLQDPGQRTVALAFYNFVSKYEADFGTIFAGAIITLIPIFVLYLLLQKRFVEGMTLGGLK